jgi:hypothetical protein
MPEMIRISPFEKVYLRHDLGPDPSTFLHLLERVKPGAGKAVSGTATEQRTNPQSPE